MSEQVSDKIESFSESSLNTAIDDSSSSVSSSTLLENRGFVAGRSNKTPEELARQQEIDSRSVYVGNVDFKTTPDELEKFFHPCGSINRVTILFDRFTGYPKGYAYVEFEVKESVLNAVNDLNGLEFKGRTITVVAKRTNLPGFKRGPSRGFRGRARGFSSRGRGTFRGSLGVKAEPQA